MINIRVGLSTKEYGISKPVSSELPSTIRCNSSVVKKYPSWQSSVLNVAQFRTIANAELLLNPWTFSGGTEMYFSLGKSVMWGRDLSLIRVPVRWSSVNSLVSWRIFAKVKSVTAVSDKSIILNLASPAFKMHDPLRKWQENKLTSASLVAAENKASSLSSSHMALLMEIVRSNELSKIRRLHRHDTTRKITLCIKGIYEKIWRRSSSGSWSMFFNNLGMDNYGGGGRGSKWVKKSSWGILINKLTPPMNVDHVQVYLGLTNVELWFIIYQKQNSKVWTNQLQTFLTWNNCQTEDQ